MTDGPGFGMGALAALGKRGAGDLKYGQAYDDKSQGKLDRYLRAAGGDHKLAAKAAWNEREKKRQRTNMAGGSSLLTVENESRFGGSDAEMLQVAAKLNNLAATKGKTTGPMAAAPQPTDPRLTTQGRNQYGRLAQDALAAHQQQVQQTAAKTQGDQQAMAERRRLMAEGDVWNAQQQQQSQAMLALATRGARTGTGYA